MISGYISAFTDKLDMLIYVTHFLLGALTKGGHMGPLQILYKANFHFSLWAPASLAVPDPTAVTSMSHVHSVLPWAVLGKSWISWWNIQM